MAELLFEENNLKPAQELVTAILAAEKEAKKNRPNYSFEQLIGTWQLRFITGTKKTRKQAGIVMGAGKYLPKFLKITLTYQKDENGQTNYGRVKNTVDLKLLKIALTGPVKFIKPQNILAFDFTRMQLQLGGITIYNGYIRSGAKTEANFATEAIKKQAFFTYFYVERSVIAARGRGGGLALWTRNDQEKPIK